ncbi:MAG: hypothetical protein ACR2MP_19445 [Streptosporangiaceae bacterium]
MDSGQTDDMAPPAGTAIVRPLRHVRAVRARYLQRFTDLAAASRSARAWAWALGETPIAPVTDQVTTAPPDQSIIEAEITVADERRLRGDRENRADSAATILRWLIGADDHVPVRCANPGELVGGFGDVVRSRQQTAEMAAAAARAQREATALSLEIGAAAEAVDRERAHQEADYLSGVTVTLAWLHGERAETPISRVKTSLITSRVLKEERLHAEDVIEEVEDLCAAGPALARSFGEGVKATISWLLGDSSIPPQESPGY